MGSNRDDVANRWVERCLGSNASALKSRNLHDHGDAIFSYGTHFEVARILRDKKKNPIAWLLNGDRWPGVVTTRHQGAVRSAVARHSSLPSVTIPHEALTAARVDPATVQIVDVQADWNTSRTVILDRPNQWSYENTYESGGWRNTLTNEFVERSNWASRKPEIVCEHMKNPSIMAGLEWDTYYKARQAYDTHIRVRHGEWEDVRGRTINTGRKTPMLSTHTALDMFDDPTAPLGHAFRYEQSRHWLGASLIRGQVLYQQRVKHRDCAGTGVSDQKWYTPTYLSSATTVSGPLTKDEMEIVMDRHDRIFRRDGIADRPIGWPQVIQPYTEHTRCRGCSGRGTVTEPRTRMAYFLSGFDENETRPSYFFCELPPKARPTTVEEAYEALKPSAVKLAEDMRREVKRQGDIFAIPVPELTLRELKKDGGVHVRKPKSGETGPRPSLLGTNHEATEIVLVGDRTYARGSIRHVPEGRRPDHKLTPLGKQWHLIVKNTVPVGV